MARVCQKMFPETDGYYMNDELKRELDIMIKNVIYDWDFTIIISGQGEMRVGKSILLQQICCYWKYQIKEVHGFDVPFNVKENLVLNGNETLKKGMALGKKYKYAPFGLDEAADDLETTKVMKGSTQQIKDYLRKAAQFNMLNVIIQSEFFEVPKPIAISRSALLIDVYYNLNENGQFERGWYNVYGRRSKKLLYLRGKKDLNYKCVRPDIQKGYFPNFFTVNEQEYKKEKREALERWEKYTGQDVRRQEWIKGAIKYMYATGLSYREIADKINERSTIKISHFTVGKLLSGEDLGIEDEEIS